MQRIKYSVEFKKEAARRLIIDGLSASKVSEKLGVKAELLYRWRQATPSARKEQDIDSQETDQTGPPAGQRPLWVSSAPRPLTVKMVWHAVATAPCS